MPLQAPCSLVDQICQMDNLPPTVDQDGVELALSSALRSIHTTSPDNRYKQIYSNYPTEHETRDWHMPRTLQCSGDGRFWCDSSFWL